MPRADRLDLRLHFGSLADLSVYNMSKAAVRQMVASLAAELAPQRIRVNAVEPGSIDTDMTRACLPDDASLAATIRKIPLGTLGQPTDIAAVCAFLCSEDAKYKAWWLEILVLRLRSSLCTEGGDAPGRQGARSEHIENIRTTSNAAGRDAAPAECQRTSET